MPSFKIVLAYDGTDFVGWQRQASGVSIQGLLEDALRELDGRDVTVIGAGRTDAGVHALGQVAAFTLNRDITADAVARAVNARLPDAVRVLSAEDVPPSFHPQFGARAKTYRYRIVTSDVLSPFERRHAWHTPGALDVDAMREATAHLIGRHDFAAFQASGSTVKTTVREVFESAIRPSSASGRPELVEGRNPQSAILELEITGSGFLRHMVRTIVGSLVEVGRGRRSAAWIAEVLASCDRTTAGPTAPAHGLVLVRVEYGETLATEP